MKEQIDNGAPTLPPRISRVLMHVMIANTLLGIFLWLFCYSIVKHASIACIGFGIACIVIILSDLKLIFTTTTLENAKRAEILQKFPKN